MNKTILISLGVFFGIVLIVGLSIMGMYNKSVTKDVQVENSWANVQTAYQRRADLIPNLVETVKGARDFEQETQTQIAEIRAQAGQIKQAVSSSKTVGDLNAVSTQMDSVLSRLLVIVEAYPNLKSNTNFLGLQDELAGTENRIKWDRDNYNKAVRDYKTYLRKFPTNMFASGWGFDHAKYDLFVADSGAEVAPTIDFG